MTKKSFDDRSQTRISLSIKAHRSSTTDARPVPLSHSRTFQWSETPAVSVEINSPDFLFKYGQACYMDSSASLIAIGTERGYVVVFGYHQEVIHVLTPEHTTAIPESPPISSTGYIVNTSVSSLAISSDSTVVVSGHTNGLIVIWELKSGQELTPPLHQIKPITFQDRFHKNKEGHLSITITSIKIFHDNQIVSSDVSGLVFYHHGVKSLLARNYITQKLLGNNDSNGIPSPKYRIYDMDILALGNTPQITDSIGMLAVVTGSMVAVLSVFSMDNPNNLYLKTHFKMQVPKAVKLTSDSLACTGWFPCMEYEGVVSNAKLAVSWNNCLSILEVDNAILPANFVGVINDLRSKDKSIPTLPISRTARKYLKDPIISLKWMSTSSVCCFTHKEVIILYYKNQGHESLKIIGKEPLGYVPNSLDFKLNKDHISRTFNSSIKLVKMRVLLLNQKHHHSQLAIGKPISWNDKLAELLAKKYYEEALNACYFFYSSKGIGELVLFSLPESKAIRKKLVHPYLMKILWQSIPHFSNCAVYFRILATLIGESKEIDSELTEMIEMLYETVSDKAEFFDSLENYLISGTITTLSPLVLKALVSYYGECGKGEPLTEILCTINITFLDIDLTIQVCQKNKLDECLIFVYNFLIHDYDTPLLHFLSEIQNNRVDPRNESKVFNYLSYILTGRQYPIDKFIEYSEEQRAKLRTINILFRHETEFLGIQVKETSIFPILTMLLKYNSFEMLSTLNEFFEDSILNEEIESSISRQFIIDALLDIYASNDFSNTDKCHLSIFVGRNYSKYSQFIRLSDSILNQILDNLLNFNHPEIKVDCELAIQSLLTAFEPFDEKKLIEKLSYKKFYNVLISIYKGEGKYYKVLQIWLNQLDEGHADLTNVKDESFNVLTECFSNTKLGIDKVNLNTLIKDNFVKLATINTNNFVYIINNYEPSLHKQILKVNEGSVVFSYLDELFKLGCNDSELIVKYSECLSQFNSSHLYGFLKAKYQFVEGNDIHNLETILSDAKQINALTIPLTSEGKYQESLDYLLEQLESIKELEKFDESFKLYLSIIESPGFYSQQQMSTASLALNLNEQYWLKLIDCLIGLSKEMPTINEFIYKSFRKISDIKLNPNDKNETSFLKIFDTFLNNNDQTTLLNVRNILIEILISYSYESEILRLSYKIINQNIHDKLNVIKYHNLKGWSISCKHCTNCGKQLYGSHIDLSNFMVWEQRQQTVLNMMSDVKDAESTDQLRLVFFKCNHGYHYKCLRNLSSDTCVVCTQ
ncbi:Vacuolar protein sorting-associated protein 8 [Yamadazyma tenuis]|uniref:Uncharacterized protein n=1 Tax=Candida tenuis (strain ATCC 10573 / BCRC 21748 / CBS 615 / JCM 9827 / NBRC 10315 / NRRL Y-1498 / VKM Y-70) TaxID=590646 RepID=G3B566_CANTC|nr:uncharacterized protein CANTEDRAFT_106995 [Yamadazyma tenuis ATCC 10573]EGV63151.1 hypothetical protein CANTEDRAFT_106995 [Yamadazyma tenuis ATCC 10573]WEJ97032.1 Vacuolar protein sorting-associated protein 8 [Yamadazyma tenuis]